MRRVFGARVRWRLQDMNSLSSARRTDDRVVQFFQGWMRAELASNFL